MSISSESSTFFNNFRPFRRDLDWTQSNRTSFGYNTSTHSSSNSETGLPSHQLRNVAESINSHNDFCRFLSFFPPYLFEGHLHHGRSTASESGRNHFACLGSGATFEVSSITAAQAGADPTDPEKSKKLIAVKVPILKHGLDSEEEERAWEIRTLRETAAELSCLTQKTLRTARNVVKYLGITWRPSFMGGTGRVRMMPSIIVERADLGTLNELFHYDMESLLERFKLKLAADVAKGMQALEICGIAHGDLKAQNVLVFSDTDDGGLLAKVSDFGFSTRNVSWVGMTTTHFKGASPPWDAPEVFKSLTTLDQLIRADIYSYGLLVWRLALHGQTPFDSRKFAMRHKGFDRLLDESIPLNQIAASLKMDGDHFLQSVQAAVLQDPRGKSVAQFNAVFEMTLRLEPHERADSFCSILDALGYTGGATTTETSRKGHVMDTSSPVKFGGLSIPGEHRKFMTLGTTTFTKRTVSFAYQ